MALAAVAFALAAAGRPALWPGALVGVGLAVGLGVVGARWLRFTAAPGSPEAAPDARSYEALVGGRPDAAVLCDATGQWIRYANAAALALAGAHDADQIAGQPVASFMRADERAALMAYLEEFVASGRLTGKPRRLHLNRLDGQERTVEAVATQVALEGRPLVKLTLWDVTARERRDAHTAYLASFPELTPIPTLEATPGGQVVYANPAARAAFPDLESGSHPLLRYLTAFRRALLRGAEAVETRVVVQERTFEARVYLVPDSENVRLYAQDVTVHHEALHGLNESREKFSRVFMRSPVPLVVVRVRDGVFVDLNDAFARLVGAQKREDLFGRTVMSMGFWGSDAERRAQMLMFRTLPIEGRLALLRRLDTGERRRVELWADRIVVEGEPCWAGVFLDVEAHMSTEEALQGERDFVQSLLDALGEGVVLADAQDQFALVNPAFERLVGMPSRTLVGTSIIERVEPSDQPRYLAQQALRQRGEASSYEICFLHADGTPRPVLVTGVPIHSGQFAGGVAAVVTDLTSLKAAQAEVERQKAYYEEILDRLPLQLATFDAEGRYRYVNPAALRDDEKRAWILGHTSLEYAAQYQLDPATMAERTRQEHAAIQGKRPVQWVETRHTPRGVQHFERVVTPVLDARDAFQYAIAYGVEVTERLEAERRIGALKDFYESILEHLPLRVMVFNSAGGLAFANAEVVPEEGQRQRLLGKPVVPAMRAAGLSSEAAERLQAHFQRARETGAVETWEEVTEGRNGAPLHLLFAVRPLDDPDASFVGYAIDVTEQRAADARTEEVKQFYERVLENIPVEVAVLDAEARVRYINPASVRDPEIRAWMVGKNSVDYARRRGFDVAPFERREAWLQEVIASRQSASLEEELALPGKPARTIVRTFTPVLRGDGTVDYLIGYSIDLTDRVAAEQQVQALKSFYETVLDTLPIEVAVIGPDSKVRYVNPAGVQDPEARRLLVGRTTLEYAQLRGYETALFERREAWVRSVIASRVPSQYEERFELPGRAIRIMQRTLTPVLDADGEVTYLIGHAVDLTDRVEAEQRVQHLKEFYENILDTLPLEVAAMDAQGRFQYLNPAALQDADARQQMIGRDSVGYAQLRGLDLRPYEQRQAWLMQIVASREQSSLEETIARPDGPPRTVLRVTRPILDDEGLVRFLVGYALDVTERRAYERGLVEAREKAEELARLKSSFLANMSHEIRTPLAGIIGFAEVLEDELEGAQREAASLVRESGMRLLDTLNSVLDLARLEAEATELTLAPGDAVEELHAAARLFGPTAARKNITFEVHLAVPDAPLPANLDSAALHRVLTNLISNALKFTHEGGITLEGAREGGEIVLRVRDTGSGMSAAFLPHVFDEFRQESSGLTRAHQGSGLGLAITKRLVGLMHGTISVESTVGVGTTFTVRLPALGADAA